jgi:hypothetical protein
LNILGYAIREITACLRSLLMSGNECVSRAKSPRRVNAEMREKNRPS